MQFFGLTAKDYEKQNTVEVWPENWDAVIAFEALGMGNWNMGPSGPVGLRYEAFREVRLALNISDQKWSEMFESIRVMESAALNEIYKDE